MSELRKVIEGWVNIQQSRFRNMIGYYTGGNIHETIEAAKKVATSNTLGQAHIKFERKDLL